jgi:D-3-phosphoglycerate dehydrogenase / 2-oxoglutarate reductase
MKVLANDGISEAGKKKLEAAGIVVETKKVDQADLINAINTNNYECVLVRSATTVRKEVIDACPGLKLIGRGGVGMDNIDVDYARSKGLKVFNTPASSSQSVAEMVIGQFFSIARGFYDADRLMPGVGGAEFSALKKKHGKGTELRGKTLGIIGFGRIGRSTASYALGCGMNVIAADLVKSDEPVSVMVGGTEVKVKVPFVSMTELLTQSDCISIHVPKQNDGSAVIAEAELASMKDGVLLVNAARGGVIDEQALLAALASGKVRAAALDVFENEPTPNPTLLKCDKLALSPHIGAATVEAQDRIGEELADHIIGYSTQ